LKQYKIIVEPEAVKDLFDIKQYITKQNCTNICKTMGIKDFSK